MLRLWLRSSVSVGLEANPSPLGPVVVSKAPLIPFRYHLANMPPLIVTGSQRSGTTIASVILSRDFNLTYIDETEYIPGQSYDNCVIHAPTFLDTFVAVHHMLPEATFVIVKRDRQEILASMKRIQWLKGVMVNWEQFLDDFIDERLQRIEALKAYLPDQTSEIHYNDLSQHPLFVNDRTGFTSRQWKQGVPIGPKYWLTPNGK